MKSNDNEYDNNAALKPFVCPPDKYCPYCCCNWQCCLVVQKRPPRHIWETWYFWLGVALLVVFILTSVCRSDIMHVLMIMDETVEQIVLEHLGMRCL
ncbi:hypothetical protein KPH14_007454 [Odynerus spinipes]|uniref:Uncharacterized protein n=1 Tax=Odynerus spinipes TaxID=1348599 RepID=A0AAD9VIM4_9HYME|nr:hypothetical protein KPH14_007454 [Odynerus spinipes]